VPPLPAPDSGGQRGVSETGIRVPAGSAGWSGQGALVSEATGRTPWLPGRLPAQLPVSSSPTPFASSLRSVSAWVTSSARTTITPSDLTGSIP
jgi:hypothetical protein